MARRTFLGWGEPSPLDDVKSGDERWPPPPDDREKKTARDERDDDRGDREGGR